jgi:BirA family biotin operon repressor/biotin-[acetyl-CoA-carboxylase] ligase
VGCRFADVRWSGSTGSTNSDAMALARDGAPEGIVVVADHQTVGRGRHARTWVAPPGGSLLVSVLLRPPAPVADAATMAAAVAMAEAVERVAGVSPQLKWPNDLVIGGNDGERKLAGILAEADWPAASTISAGWREPAPYERAVVVVGVGINVTWPAPGSAVPPGPAVSPGSAVPPAPAAPPGPAVPPTAPGGTDPVAEVAATAVALNWIAPPVDRVDLLVAFLRCLDRHYTALLADGPQGIRDEWRRRSATLGRRVRVDLGADDVEGTAVDVTADGHLVVQTLEGARRTLAVGDVVHLRPG